MGRGAIFLGDNCPVTRKNNKCKINLFNIASVQCSYMWMVTNIYLLKVNNRNTRKRCEKCSKLTIKQIVIISFKKNCSHFIFVAPFHRFYVCLSLPRFPNNKFKLLTVTSNALSKLSQWNYYSALTDLQSCKIWF